MTELESRTMTVAAVFLLAVSVVRWAVSGHERPLDLPADTAALPELLADSRDSLEEARTRARPLDEGERIDANRAGEAELDRLPGVGPSVARRIVAARDSAGPFLRPEDLTRVRGIGPATVAKLRPFLDLEDPPGRRLTRPGAGGDPTMRRTLGESFPASPGARNQPLVDLNRADSRALQELPGVGPALAERILERRRRVGRFRSVEDLLDVRGIGPATLERIRPRVRRPR